MTATDVTCNGENDGTITINMQGAPWPFRIEWTDDDLTDVAVLNSYIYFLPALGPGTYSAIVTDGNGCSVTRSVTITEPTVLTASSTATTGVSCFGGNDGTATVSAYGGTAPYSYLWSTGSTSKTATGLSEGTYSVLVMDASGCTTSVESVIIDEPATPVQVSIDVLNTPSCEGDRDGELQATASGGSGGWTYLWSYQGATVDHITGLPAGTYTVIARDVKGCEATATVVLVDPTGISALITNYTDVSCHGGTDGTATVEASGGTATYTYQWSASAGPQTGPVRSICRQACIR